MKARARVGFASLPLAARFASLLVYQSLSIFTKKGLTGSRMAPKSTSRTTASTSASKETKGRFSRGAGAHTVHYAEKEEEIDEEERLSVSGRDRAGGDDDDEDDVDPVR